MNNFDDLFEQQPQPEATEKPEPQKEKPKKQWWQIREEKQRKEAYATLDRVFGAFSEGHGDMKAYLDTQSRFPFHSARNLRQEYRPFGQLLYQQPDHGPGADDPGRGAYAGQPPGPALYPGRAAADG